MTSLISGEAEKPGAGHKLTIIDAGLGVSGSATLDGTKATATYTYRGQSLRLEAIGVQALPQGQVPAGHDGSAARVSR